MSRVLATRLFARADLRELELCLRGIRHCQRKGLTRFFGIISRLGDGLFWYVLIGLISLTQPVIAAHILLTGATGTILYKLLKRYLVRERPCITHRNCIDMLVPALDRYSFPSGHTLHAVLFTTLISLHLPWVGLMTVPFTLLVALSRVVLGLHYPSDVVAGALLGASLALLSYHSIPLNLLH